MKSPFEHLLKRQQETDNACSIDLIREYKLLYISESTKRWYTDIERTAVHVLQPYIFPVVIRRQNEKKVKLLLGSKRDYTSEWKHTKMQ